MPDKRRHRGHHPEDPKLFGPDALPRLGTAVRDLSLLLTRGYAERSSLKLVGDRYELTARQRLAVLRSCCSDEARRGRQERRVAPETCRGADLVLDGYNVLITVESALAGGYIFRGRDGCLRDLAGLHGTYRHVQETSPAIALVRRVLAEMAPARCTWLLDAPVSNSGRLKGWILEAAPAEGPPWEVRLVQSPDRVLAEADAIVATSDSWVLDRAAGWVNMAGRIVQDHVPEARIVDLSEAGDPP
jgi:hypothetical protein